MAFSVFIQILLLGWVLFTLYYFKSEIKELLVPNKKPKGGEPQDRPADEIIEDDFVGSAEAVDFDLLNKPLENEPTHISADDETSQIEQQEEYEEELNPDGFEMEYESEPIPNWLQNQIEIEISAQPADEDVEVVDHSGVTVAAIEKSVNEVYNPTSEQASKEAVKVIDGIDETELIEQVKKNDFFNSNMERLWALNNN